MTVWVVFQIDYDTREPLKVYGAFSTERLAQQAISHYEDAAMWYSGELQAREFVVDQLAEIGLAIPLWVVWFTDQGVQYDIEYRGLQMLHDDVKVDHNGYYLVYVHAKTGNEAKEIASQMMETIFLEAR